MNLKKYIAPTALLLLLAGCSGQPAGKHAAQIPSHSETPWVSVFGSSTVAASPPAPSPVETYSPTPVAVQVPTIDDGTWTIGEDYPAGTYKTTGSDQLCYWAIYKSGQNQSFDSIITNHNGGGNLRVTLKAGQDFETERCGTWTLVK